MTQEKANAASKTFPHTIDLYRKLAVARRSAGFALA
jgi:hypothetical protein